MTVASFLLYIVRTPSRPETHALEESESFGAKKIFHTLLTAEALLVSN